MNTILKSVTLALLLLIINIANAQYNFVPNFDFEDGATSPICVYDYCSPPGNISSHIYYWQNANVHAKCKEKCNTGFLRQCTTSDWFEKGICGQTSQSAYSNSLRFIGLIIDEKEKRDAVNVRLPIKLPAGYYVIKLKASSSHSGIGENLNASLHLTKWESAWNSNRKGNVRIKNILSFSLYGKTHEWHEFASVFEVPSNKMVKWIY